MSCVPSDLSETHRKEVGDQLHLEVTMAVDPSLEELAAALFMDGSDSMRHAGNYGRRGLLSIGRQFNPVEASMRVIVPYIAEKDANKRCRLAYWATGSEGTEIDVIGEMTGAEAATASFRGPAEFGAASGRARLRCLHSGACQGRRAGQGRPWHHRHRQPTA